MVKKTDFVTRTLTKKGKCISCWREFSAGDQVVTPIKDEIFWTNSIYCPRGMDHLDNVSDYKNYLKEHKNITEETKLNFMAHKWELHRMRKGYLDIADVKEVTKANKEAYDQVIEFKVQRQQRELSKLHKTYIEERQKILDQIVELSEEKENL